MAQCDGLRRESQPVEEQMSKAICAAWLLMAVSGSAMAQIPAVPDVLQQKMQALHKASAENEQKLHEYQWIETTTVTINGRSKAPRQSICRYAPDGSIVRVPLGPQPMTPVPSGGPVMRHVMERKIEEAKETMAEVQGLTRTYLPLKPGALEKAFSTRRVEFVHSVSRENSIIINDYVKAGDKLILNLNLKTMQLGEVHVESYFTSPVDRMTAVVQFAMLPDGTSYPHVITIEAPEKRLSIVTVQSKFSRPVQ